jgi:iron complex outermembrane receptor protein
MVRKLQGLLWAIGMVSGMAASAAAQEPLSPGSPVLSVGDSPVETLRERPQPATTVKDWVAQIEAATVPVTSVKLERSETGLDIVLETAAGKPLQVDTTKFRREGNNLIAEIPNAVLALPEGQAFSAENPTADIATVQVVQRSGNIRVSVAGNNALPKTEVTLKTGGLAYSLNPEGDEPDVEIVVTGDRVREGYRVPSASTATRTDTALRDIPQSIQVIPKQVLQDRQPTNLVDALRSVPGISQARQASTSIYEDPVIRGFGASEFDVLRNGLISPYFTISNFDSATIERIEVLRGPASVLFGQGSLGGVINRPLA